MAMSALSRALATGILVVGCNTNPQVPAEDRARPDPRALLALSLQRGPDRKVAVDSLLRQADHRDAQDALLEYLKTGPLEREKPEIAWVLAQFDRTEAVDHMMAKLLDPKTADAREWLEAFLRIRRIRLGPYMLRLIGSPGPPQLDPRLFAAAAHEPSIPPATFLRALFASPQPAAFQALKVTLRERLVRLPRETLQELAGLLDDAAVRDRVLAVIERVTGKRPEPSSAAGAAFVAALPREVMSRIQREGAARRLLVALPGVEDEAAVSAAVARQEAACHAHLDLGFPDLLPPALGHSEVRVRWPQARFAESHCLETHGILALVTDPAGQTTVLVGQPPTQPASLCPDPRECEEGPRTVYYVFRVPAGETPSPVFPRPGRYTVTLETPQRGLVKGPLQVELRAPLGVAGEPP